MEKKRVNGQRDVMRGGDEEEGERGRGRGAWVLRAPNRGVQCFMDLLR